MDAFGGWTCQRISLTFLRLVAFHRVTKTVLLETICRSLKRFSQKHADNFVPLPYQPENNDIPVQTPPTGFDALRTIAVSRISLAPFSRVSGVERKSQPLLPSPRYDATRQRFPARVEAVETAGVRPVRQPPAKAGR